MAGIYIHIPFCKSRCYYCDFYSTTGMEQSVVDRYVDAIAREFTIRRQELGGEPVRTVYIGGGTPSQLTPSQLRTIIAALDHGDVEEFTIEVNPDDVSIDYASMLRDVGVNRVSMGVQSFVDSELAAVNRRHNARQAFEAIEAIKNAGIDNMSIDLIYGLPGQSLDTWKYSVDKAVNAGVKHISAYNLTYESGTRLTRMRDAGEIAEADDELCLAMYNALVDTLRVNGFEHYEISNFTLTGYRSRHNSAYWDFTPYLGLGAAAHSFDGRCRRYNPANIHEYLRNIESGKPAVVTESLEWWERYDEMVMVRLRTVEGLSLATVEREFGPDIKLILIEKSKQMVDRGLLTVDNDFVRLTPYAIMLSDMVITQLMYDKTI